MTVKQVIVMRTDLGMRKGKMIAQGAHASIAFLTKQIDLVEPDAYNPHGFRQIEGNRFLSKAEIAWLTGKFTKICVRADSEEELLDVAKRAEEAGVTCSLIQDAGLTEFGGVPTYTCLALGPDEAENIDAITGSMTLL